MKRLIVQLWRTSAEQPNLAITPLLMATTAAAMNINVEIHVIGSSVDLFIICSAALRDSQLDLKDLVEGVSEMIGMVTMIDLAIDSNTTVLTY